MSVETARALRKSMTPQEARLWLRLRDMRAVGFHFRRQAPRDGYILDFVCMKKRIIVEIDGLQHGFDRNLARDRERDAHFDRNGFTTLRFTNGEVNVNIAGVIETIHAALTAADQL